MRSRAFALLALTALLAVSLSAAAEPVEHWRTTLSKGAVHQYEKAKATVNGLALPAVDAGEAVAQAEAAVDAVTTLDPQALLDGLGDPLAPVQDALDGLNLPPLPAVEDAAAFAVRVVQYQATRAVHLYDNLRP